mmetsp:Transcript_16143/g.20513  ORF Transcript_16143/g.20513 Transcript_16143/m.20513 type:complete len:122 (-) Transcript_16143:308-673(-)
MTNKEYVWNYDLLKDFKIHAISPRWIVPLIQGYCTTDNMRKYLSKPVSLTLISKRSTARAGTRFNSRGVDEDGKVANFVTTELIVEQSSYLFAHVQIRGSVPLFWSQKAKKSTKVCFKDNW